MSDGYGYDPYGRQPEIIGYDEYGRPVYRQETPQDGSHPGGQGYGPGTGAYDPYASAQPPQQGGYGQGAYDPYAAQTGTGEQGGAYAPHGTYQDPASYSPYDAASYPADYGRQQAQQHGTHEATQTAQQQAWLPGQGQYGEQGYAAAPQDPGPYAAQQTAPAQHTPEPQPAQHTAGPYAAQPHVPGQRTAGPPAGEQPAGGERGQGEETAGQQGEEGDYRTEQFSFVEESSDDSEDVIDWLKFSESRTERREEARRRGRNRVVALVVVLALVVAGGVGYLWYAGMLPGLGGGDEKGQAAAGTQRDVIVVHLRERGGTSSTALLVDNEGAGQGTTVLLPNSLAVSTENGTTTTLGKSVDDQGAGPTRDALNTLLGADIEGTWRLDTPFLENLVELVGGIDVDTDTTVPGKKKGAAPLVEQGAEQSLNGRTAVAYATYRAQGEPQDKQLARFGQVMQAVLKKISTDPGAATKTVESLGQIPDPSLSESQLGASLAKLATHAKKGDYRTQVLPVQPNGTLSEQVSDQVVGKVLGGSVKNSDPDAAPRVSVKNATGKPGLDNAASAALVNAGYTVVKGGTGGTHATSVVGYAKAAQRDKAVEVAKTLGLPGSAVRKADGSGNADVTVILGADYEG
ncbi:LytR C-terminal domain-containing protein [Streptomyces albus]|uniref:LCP family protein n=1 Tax=Streptomyces albus TaxID=1888 RepID=UPI0036FE7CDE